MIITDFCARPNVFPTYSQQMISEYRGYKIKPFENLTRLLNLLSQRLMFYFFSCLAAYLKNLEYFWKSSSLPMSSLLSSKTFSSQKWQINSFLTRIYSVILTHIFQQGTVSAWTSEHWNWIIPVRSLIRYCPILKQNKIQTSPFEIYCNEFDSSWPIIHSAIRFVQTWRSI